MGVYHIAQVLYLLGNPREPRISGKTYQKMDMDKKRREQSGYDVEELGIGLVRLAGDVTLDIIEAWAIHLDAFEGSAIVGNKGGVRLNPFGFFRSAGYLDLSSTADLEKANFRWHNVAGDHAHYAGAAATLDRRASGQGLALPTAQIALNTMLISEGIYLSRRRCRSCGRRGGRIIRLDRRLRILIEVKFVIVTSNVQPAELSPGVERLLVHDRVLHLGWAHPVCRRLLEMTRPGVLVELGTFKGDSYCGFCQGVTELAVLCDRHLEGGLADRDVRAAGPRPAPRIMTRATDDFRS